MRNFCLALLLHFILFCYPQTQNMDFEEGNFDRWTLDIGVRTTPETVDWTALNPNELRQQIRIMDPSLPPLDEYGLLCDPELRFPTVYPGGNFSARIGDNPGGWKAARISRTFVVTPEESYLRYSYAVILEEPGHSREDQPKFVVNIRDREGRIVDCGQFEAFAGPDAAEKGFSTCLYERRYRCDFPITDCPNSTRLGVTPVQILPWTTGGADLTPFIGQEITIEFVALDCMRGAHGGTAYVEAALEPLEIRVEGLCSSGLNDIVLSAPVGFTSYLWSTGETSSSITVSGAQYGDTYSVELIANTGCNTSASLTLAPQAAVTIDPIPDMEICPGGMAIIRPTGTAVGSFYFPELGVTGDSATVSPSETTTYTVIARDENGCDGDSTTVTVTVLPNTGPPYPNADFELETIAGDEGNPCLAIRLTNLSDYCRGDLTYFWDFGDGTTSTEENPTHQYPATADPQTYYIRLTVTSLTDGLTDSRVRSFTTSEITADFYLDENCGVVNITNASEICGEEFNQFPGYTYTWDFGDGSPLVTTGSDEFELSHTYTESGVYTIRLDIWDEAGNPVDSRERQIDVSVRSVADFAYFPDCYEVTFADQSVTCDPIQSYRWDFGDGSPPVTNPAPTHTYAGTGPYTVRLTVDEGSQLLTVTRTISLSPDEVRADFAFDLDCDEVRFVQRSGSCVPLTYAWDFGDGSPVETVAEPIHLYAFGQTYPVTLTVSDGNRSYSITREVSIRSEFEYQPPYDLRSCADPSSPEEASFNFFPLTEHILAGVSRNGPFYPPVTYHTSREAALAGTAQVYSNFVNSSNPQVLYARVEDSRGCVETFPFEVEAFATPAAIEIGDVELCTEGRMVLSYELSRLHARIFEGLNASETRITYHLLPTEASMGLNPILTLNLSAGIDYIVYIRAENSLAPECFTLGSVRLRVDNESTDIDNRCTPYYPNTMTPNGDGANDTFFIKNIAAFPGNHLTIYNRWGNKVYETRGYDNTWDGTFEGNPLPVGTYYFHIRLNDVDNRSHSGYLTILR